MNRIIIKTAQEGTLPAQRKRQKRGAQVYGFPISRELDSYLDDAAPESQQQRFLSMFFAGKLSIPSVSEDESEDFEEDEVFPGEV